MDRTAKIDLHMHTALSDGTDSPAEILARVREAGIGLFSVTDHDAVSAGEVLPGLLKKGDPAFITGVEFSCRDGEGQYHILGYGCDPLGRSITETVEFGRAMRHRKVRARLEFLEEAFGFTFTPEETEELLNQYNPGKPHIGNLMVRHGYAATRKQAIEEFIDKKSFPDEQLHPDVAIRGILESGGIPVLAHPFYGSGDQLVLGQDMEDRLVRLMGFGLRGLECCYSGFTARLRGQALALAEAHGLYVTAGSDYHGTNKIVELGDTGLEAGDALPEGLVRFLEDVRIHEASD